MNWINFISHKAVARNHWASQTLTSQNVQAQWQLTVRITYINSKNLHIFPTHCIYVLHMILIIKSIYVDGIKEFVFVIKRQCVVYCEVNAEFFCLLHERQARNG
jgi:hypothetical protein